MTVRERPILFSGAMVRALLAGTKTQTRRVIKPQPVVYDKNGDPDPAWEWRARRGGYAKGGCGTIRHMPEALRSFCPYGEPGDRLWVRETWASYGDPDAVGTDFIYRADGPRELTEADHVLGARRWRPSIHMPRWASRIRLEVTRVRVERIQGISEEDAVAEGCCIRHDFSAEHHPTSLPPSARSCFSAVWDALNAKRGFGWQANPWVWVVEVRRLDP